MNAIAWSVCVAVAMVAFVVGREWEKARRQYDEFVAAIPFLYGYKDGYKAGAAEAKGVGGKA